MLPAAHRIRTAADFRETTRRAARATRGSVVVYLDLSDDARPPRVGVITSASIGGSVVRHRAARRMRAAAAKELPALPVGSRLVLRALPGADRDPLLPQQVHAAVIALIARAGLSP